MHPRTPAIARRAHCGCCRRCVTRKRQWALGGPLRRLRSALSDCARRRLRGTVRVGGDRRASKYDALPLRLHRFIHPCFRGGGGGRRAALSTAVVGGCLEGQVDRRDCEDGSDPCPTAPGTAPGRQAFLAKKLGSGHRDPAYKPGLSVLPPPRHRQCAVRMARRALNHLRRSTPQIRRWRPCLPDVHHGLFKSSIIIIRP